MTPAFNPMDPVPGNRSRQITSRRLARNLLSIAIGTSLGILFVSLVFAPVQSYAAQAKLDTTTVPPAHRLIVGPTAAQEQVASIDRVQPAPTGSLRDGSGSTPAYSPDTLP